MGSYDEILGQVPIDQLASQLGVGSDEVRQATEHALPALLGGLHANASDPAGASSLLAALSDHQGPVNGLDDVDEQDGRAIVGNIFGGSTDQVVNQLGGLGGASGGLVQKLLPILAPIVMSWLANKMGQGGLGGHARRRVGLDRCDRGRAAGRLTEARSSPVAPAPPAVRCRLPGARRRRARLGAGPTRSRTSSARCSAAVRARPAAAVVAPAAFPRRRQTLTPRAPPLYTSKGHNPGPPGVGNPWGGPGLWPLDGGGAVTGAWRGSARGPCRRRPGPSSPS